MEEAATLSSMQLVPSSPAEGIAALRLDAQPRRTVARTAERHAFSFFPAEYFVASSPARFRDGRVMMFRRRLHCGAAEFAIAALDTLSRDELSLYAAYQMMADGPRACAYASDGSI